MHASRINAGKGRARAPDHALIAATAAVRQARTRTARAAAALDRPAPDFTPADTLVAVLRASGTPAGGGSFHPNIARQG